jgi:hypothetical protein
MKRMIFFLTSSFILLSTYCTQVNFNNPIDPKGKAYKGDSLSRDDDGDGIANEFDLDYWKINDKTPPVITFNGGIGNHDTVIFRQGDPEAVLTTTATVTAADNISKADKITISNNGLFTSQCAVQAVTYTATDEAGNSSSKTRIIIVDCDPPVIVLAGDNPVNLQVGGTYTESGATASDNIDGPVTITTTGMVSTANEHIDTITYTARDRAGNVATKKRLVVISQAPDTDPPTITLLGNNPLTLTEGTPYTEPGYTATDVRDGNLHDQVVVTGGPVVTTIAGRDTLTYSVSDKAGNPAVVKRIIIIIPIGPVVDTIKPDITLKGALSIEVPVGGVYTEPGWTATDNVDGDLTSKVTVSELDNKPLPINTSTPATYNLVYSVTDSAGNTRTVSREVRVVGTSTDTVKPVITLEGAVQCTVNLGLSFIEPGATATDNVDGVISDKITKVVKNAAGAVASITPATVIGDYTITYSVSDKAGNAAVPKVRNVYCKDTFVDPNDLLSKYGVPLKAALPSITHAYNGGATTDGDGAPNVSNITAFTLAWDLGQGKILQFAFNTSDGVPSFYFNLSPANTFASANPGFTLASSGITGLDGEYYIKADATQCVWVKKDGKFAIVFK